MLTIRLRRIGKRKHATFRFIVSEKTRSPQSRANEFLGSYDPHANPPTVKLERERVQYWLSHGAQTSDTVHNILVDAGLLEGPKVKIAHPKKKESGEATADAGQVGSLPARSHASAEAGGSAGEVPKKEQTAPLATETPVEAKTA